MLEYASCDLCFNIQCMHTVLPSESGRSKTENWSSGIAAENLLSSDSKSVA